MTRAPDYGAIGTRAAWRLRAVNAVKWPAALGAWIVEARGDHVAWWHWGVTLIHLRDVPGTTPAMKRYDKAEYELVSAALDPAGVDHVGEFEAGRPLMFMTPVDWVLQFHGVDDERAVMAVQCAVVACTEGILSPDHDWKRIWTDWMIGHGAKMAPRFEVNQVGHA